QTTGAPHIISMIPLTERLSSRLPAQSASEYATSSSDTGSTSSWPCPPRVREHTSRLPPKKLFSLFA
ncbi:hypothetical protein PHYSODRAFT_480167, partial [Phytophthora sojae]